MSDEQWVEDDCTCVEEPQEQEYVVEEEVTVEYLDDNADGIPDVMAVADSTGGYVVVDADYDGSVDALLLDSDGDGQPDVSLIRDGDQIVVGWDLDASGVPASVETLSYDELVSSQPELADIFNAQFSVDGLVPAGAPTDQAPVSEVPVDETTYVEPGQTTDDAPTTGEQVWDTNNDNIPDVLSGQDGTSSYAILDTDYDTQVDAVLIDVDGDGLPDVSMVREGDLILVGSDLDANGVPGQVEQLTLEDLRALDPQLADLFSMHFTQDGLEQTPTDGTEYVNPPEGDPADPTDPTNTPPESAIVGDPIDDANNWFMQGDDSTCVPSSVAMIVTEYTGIEFQNEDAFVALAIDLGMQDPRIDGMQLEDAVKLLNASGVPATMEEGSLADLRDALESGHGVMVPVDSGEIWTGEPSEDNQADHMVVVVGIDLERGTVLLNDPGTPGGQLEEVPIALFDNAWADADHAMIVCDEPAPDSGGDVVQPSAELVNAGSAPMSADLPAAETATQAGATSLFDQPQFAGQAHVVDETVRHAGGWILLPALVGLAAGAAGRGIVSRSTRA